jgi:hypothetical protein
MMMTMIQVTLVAARPCKHVISLHLLLYTRL